MKFTNDIDLENGDIEFSINDLDLKIELKGNGWSKMDGFVNVTNIALIMDSKLVSERLSKDEMEKLINDIMELDSIEALHVLTEETLKEIPMYLNVTHDSSWEIYNDYNFEGEISKFLHLSCWFTEQGMQQDNFASMEN